MREFGQFGHESSAVFSRCSAAQYGLWPILPVLLSSVFVAANSAKADSIVPAADGTGTTVSQTGERFDIDGGTHSTDAQNLFHSFKVFSLEVGEQANFITQPSVQNVLARVSGGVPSILNGLIQVSGESGPNLFLLNPAGVLFGAEARLNLPGNLTVTTADAVGFSQGWFNAIGENNYSALLGAPTGEFAFLSDFPGSIVNEGALSLGEDAALTLMGGNVVNTGSLTVPGGTLTLVALPDGEHVRLSQAGSLLSLELSMLSPDEAAGVNAPTLTPLDLPALLTMTAAHSASALAVDADGSVRLTAGPDQTTVQVGDQPGDATLSGDISVEAVVGEQAVGGAIAVMGDRIALFDASLSASGNSGGGTIHIGGNYRGGENLPHAQHTWIDANSVLSADAHEQGAGGQVIVWADDTTQHFGHISATGGLWGGDGGFVEVSGKSRLRFQGTVDTRAEQGQVGSLLLDPENITITSTFSAAHDSEILDGNIFAADGGSESFFISENTLESLSGSTDVTLEATNDITIQDLDDDLLNFFSGNSITIKADADGNGAGSVFMNDINDTLAASGQSLTISGNQLELGNLDTSGPEIGGDITLISDSSVSTGNLVSAGFQQGGNLSISASESIFIEDADTSSNLLSGDIDIVSQAGDITTGSLFVGEGSGDIGSVNLAAPGVIIVDGELQSEGGTQTDPNLDDDDYFYDYDDGWFSDDWFGGDDYFGIDDGWLADDLLALEGDGFEGEFDDGFGNDFDDGFDDDFDDGFGDEFDSELADEFGEDADFDEEADGEYYDDYYDDYGYDYDYGPVDLDFVVLDSLDASAAIADYDETNNQDFFDYFGRDFATQDLSIEEVQQLLNDVETRRNSRSAVVYIQTPIAATSATDKQNTPVAPPNSTALTLLVMTADGSPVQVSIPVGRRELLKTVAKFRSDLLTSVRRGGDYYLEPAQQLYQWLIAPIEAELEKADIETLVLSMGEGLRTLPIAALHDGEQFLVEKYSLGMVPSLSLLNTDYEPLDSAQVLAMGASDFAQLAPLPGVPLEIDLINQLWPGAGFLNENFTRHNLVAQRQASPYQVVHLATHAEFNEGAIDNSYIQLWDEQLLLSQLDQLGWSYPAVDLLVLSACSTALGSSEAEMGFAGLAVASGVRTAMASLWSVNDLGTLALMGEFYNQLKVAPTKSAALRTAQLAMLRREVHTEDGQLVSAASRSLFSLPPELHRSQAGDFSHPYYWSGFTMIGSPW
ncbi:MAG: CHAT domain-containing protein [Cyanobacteria bacterium J06623_5]